MTNGAREAREIQGYGARQGTYSGSRRLTSLKMAEIVRVHLKGRKRSGTFAFTGVVTKVDDRAIRLEPAIDMFTIGGSLPLSRRVDGATVIPWSSIESIRIEAKETR